MTKRRVLTLAIATVLAVPALSRAQSTKLAHLLPTLYGQQGLFVDSAAPLPDGSTHSAHFNNAFHSRFTQFNAALASQLSALPLPAPSSGFTYTMDATLGVLTRSTQSFGPIMAERAETIGKGKYAVGFAVQHFSFDGIEGIDLGALPAVFTHDGAAPGGRADVVTTSSSVAASLTQQIGFVTWGLGERIDASLAVPFVIADLSVTSLATIQRLGTGTNTIVHYSRGRRRSGTTTTGWRSRSTCACRRATRKTCWARAPGACGRSWRPRWASASSRPTSTSATSGTARACWPETSRPARPPTWPTSSPTWWGRTWPWAGA
jgi:hypothetical protein